MWQAVDAFIGEQIGAFVQFMPGVTLDPVPLHLMAGARLVQAALQVLVLDGLLVGCLPAA